MQWTKSYQKIINNNQNIVEIKLKENKVAVKRLMPMEIYQKCE